MRQILICGVHWEFSKKGTQDTVVILALVSGTENVDNGKDSVVHCEPFELFQFVPENIISQKEKKMKNSRNRHAVNKHIHKEKRRHRYAKPNIGKINTAVIHRVNSHAGKCQISTNKQLH